MTPRPDISIAVIAYNHERFIQDTFRGIALQQFSGTVEVVIGDDCSTDRTREMATAFAAAHPSVKLLFHAKNGGMVHNWTTTIDACTGRYIALCEGDDYWTDPLKLQKQVAFMEANEECSLCGHDGFAEMNGKRILHRLADEVHEITRMQLIKHNPSLTATLMFRRDVLPMPEWFASTPFCDYALQFLCITKGRLYHLPEAMAVYRWHDSGIHTPLYASASGKMEVWKKHIYFYRLILANMALSSTEQMALKDRISECYMSIWVNAREHQLYLAVLKYLPMRLRMKCNEIMRGRNFLEKRKLE